MSCSRKNSCELFPLISINGALKIWQSFYCDGNFQTCVRYQLGLEGKSIPATLLPNGKNLDLGAAGLNSAETDETEDSADYPSDKDSMTTDEKEPGNLSNYYLRMRVDESDELHARIAEVLKECGVDVEMMMEKDLDHGSKGKSAVFLTDFVSEESINGALNRIEKLEGIKHRPVCIMLEKSG